jgi:hypothetical protein
MPDTLSGEELEFLELLGRVGEETEWRDPLARRRWIDSVAQVGLFEFADDVDAIPVGGVWRSALLLSAVRRLAQAGVRAAIPDIIVARRELVRTGQGERLDDGRIVGLSLGSDGRELSRNADLVSAVVAPAGDGVHLLPVRDSGMRAGWVADLGW